MNVRSNIWWTRKARIETEKRLLANAFQSQLLMIWYSFSSVAVSIFYLSPQDDWPTSNEYAITWVVFSILTLLMSVFLSGLSFKERAGLVKDCYESLKELYDIACSGVDDEKISKSYMQIIRVCENHSDKDYYMALFLADWENPGRRDPCSKLKPNLDRAPSKTQISLLVFWCLRRWAMLLGLYALPFLVFMLTR